jgi:nucleotide-binding universal stress UspA family protein
MSTGPILLAVEMSEDDRPLLEVAQLYAKALGAKLYLVHVMPPAPDFVGLPKEGEAEPAGGGLVEPLEPGDVEVGYAYDRGLAAERARAAHAELAIWRELLETSGVPTTALLIEGPAAEKIAGEARKLDCGLIIVGAHQRSLLGQWLHGNTSRQILQDAPCPVLVVPAGSG